MTAAKRTPNDVELPTDVAHVPMLSLVLPFSQWQQLHREFIM